MKRIMTAVFGIALLYLGASIEGQPLKAILIAAIGLILFMSEMFDLERKYERRINK